MTEINGAEIEAVDVITFGSPCQDLSVAGKRAGLKHSATGDDETTRSGLFMEAVRIIKEMRRATNGEYPKLICWENVPGAFSSNSGEDFRTVLEELIKIVEPEAPAIPSPGKAGWPYADCIVGDGWSLAWRVFDAQYWPGTPQRRRRIYLFIDLTGECAEKVLFERPGLRGNSTESGTPGEATAGDPQSGIRADDPESGITIQGTIAVDQGGGKSSANFSEELAPTLTCTHGGEPAIAYTFQPVAFTQNQRDELRDLGDKAGAIQAEPGMKQQTFIIDNIGGQAEYGKESQVNGTLRAGAQGAIAYCFENHSQDTRYKGPLDTSQTVSATFGMGGNNQPFVVEKQPIVYDGSNITCPTNAANPQPGDPCHTLSTDSRNYLTYCLQGNGIDRADTAGCNGKGWTEDVCYTLNTIDRPAVAYGLDRASFNQGQNALYDFSVLEEQQPTLTAKGPGAVCQEIAICVADQPTPKVDIEGKAFTLNARDYKAPQSVAFQTYQDVSGPLMANSHPGSYTGQDAFSDMLVAGADEDIQYIVRRLTPTECARLQGFPDRWGDIPQKETLTDEEYHFWLNVRNTHAAINGREAKVYSKEQLLKWYNKLHSDSSEYKMWGNGIALPNALYVMQGIEDALRKKEK